jgi:thiol-disulfide isomerase/thioredoxin
VIALRRAITGLLVLGLAAPVVGCGNMGAGASSAAGDTHPLIGGAAPGFDLTSPDGKKKITLANVHGKVIIVDFWATWCGPCRESFPVYERLSNKFGSKLAVIAVSVDEDPGSIAQFVKDTGATFQIGWDDGQVVSKSYQPPTMPTSFVIDKSGIVRFMHSGFRSGEEAELEQEVASLAAK